VLAGSLTETQSGAWYVSFGHGGRLVVTRSLTALLALAALTFAVPRPDAPVGLKGQALVDYINAQGKWTAKLNTKLQDKATLKAHLGSLTPSRPSPQRVAAMKAKQNRPAVETVKADIPKSFDARTAFPECTETISRIADQSACGSCWAVSAATVMSDRVCIHSKGKITTQVSTAEVTSCAMWWDGCQGGWEDVALDYWVGEGVVSGTGFAEDGGCKPYPFPECEHHQNGTTSRPPCPKETYQAPDCVAACQPGYTENSYYEDKIFGKNLDYFSGEEEIQQELIKNGPIAVSFRVYEDFVNYNTGVYEHVYGIEEGGHAVRLIGWGEEDDGTKYWIVANNWNDEWAEQGTFRIIRGQNECGIESYGAAALPK